MTSEQRKSERFERAEQRKAEKTRERSEKQEREAFERFISFSFVRKLERASKHIEDLYAVQEAWLRTGAYTLVREDYPETGRTIIRAQITEPPPPLFSVTLGDATHALRATLDHLALELAVSHHSPSPVPPEVERASEFPVFPAQIGNDHGRDVFHRVKKGGEPDSRSGLHKLQGVHPDALKTIEGIQPYHRGASYAEDPLWLIHELDRIDKHRRLNLTAYAIEGVGINGGYMGHVVFEKASHGGAVQDGTVVLAFRASPDSHFQLDITREIALAEPTLPNAPLAVKTLTQLRDYLRDRVIPLLKPFL